MPTVEGTGAVRRRRRQRNRVGDVIGSRGRAALGVRRIVAKTGEVWVPPRRRAPAILAVVIAGYGALAFTGAVLRLEPGQAVLSGLFVVALLVLQLGYLSRPDLRPRAPWSLVALAVQAVLVFVPLGLLGPVWYGMPGLLAGSALLVLPRGLRIPAFLVVVAVLAVTSVGGNPLAGVADGVSTLAYVITSTVTSGIAVFGLTTLVRLVVEAHEAREELGRAAVSRERVRIARDVHDLLGQCLSEIALRGELVVRLLGHQAGQAREELGRLLVLSRRALADVRTVVGIQAEMVGEEETPEAEYRTADRAGPQLGPTMLGIVLVDFSVVLVVLVLQAVSPAAALALAVSRIVLVVLVLYAVRAGRKAPARSRAVLLAALAVLVYVPILYLGPYANGAPAVLGGVALVLLGPSALGIAIAVLTWASSLVVEYVAVLNGLSTPVDVVYYAVGGVIPTAIVYGLGTVGGLVAEINATRAELRRGAVVRERVRFARDVHDLLGLGLSAIALKCDLTGKLLDRAPDRARAELADVLTMTQRSLTEVRSLIGGDRELSLEQEWLAVESALVAAEVQVRLHREGEAPSGPPGTVLATVLREGATNVLRHSAAAWCEISLRAHDPRHVTLEIVNDGVGSVGATGDGSGGNGLRNMTDRVESLGGELVVRAEGPLYRLRATVPVDA